MVFNNPDNSSAQPGAGQDLQRTGDTGHGQVESDIDFDFGGVWPKEMITLKQPETAYFELYNSSIIQ